MRVLVLYNPAAGKVKSSRGKLESLTKELLNRGLQVEVRQVSEPQVKAFADFSEFGALLILGGDGTIHHLLPFVVASAVPVAIVPAGTANVLARELGIPTDWKKALQVFYRGRRRRICLGQANGTYFHLMAGIGLDAELIGRVSPGLKRRAGVLAYWITGLTRFWTCPIPLFKVAIEGEAFFSTFAVVSNSCFYGDRLVMAPQASLFEDCLDVCIFQSKHRYRFVLYLLACLSGRHIRLPDVIYRKCREISITGDRSIEYQLDGEIGGRLPARFRSAGCHVEVYVP